MTRSFLRKARSFPRQPGFIQIWFITLWFWLGISKALIFTISFRRLAPHLGRRFGIAPWLSLLQPH